MKKMIKIPTMKEALNFRLVCDDAETLAEKKTAERIAERVAEALGIAHDGFSEKESWVKQVGQDDRWHSVELIEIAPDDVHLSTPGGPLGSVWVPITQEDSAHGVAYVLATLTILQNPEEIDTGLVPALLAARRGPVARRDYETVDVYLERCQRWTRVLLDASELMQSRWTDVANTASAVWASGTEVDR